MATTCRDKCNSAAIGAIALALLGCTPAAPTGGNAQPPSGQVVPADGTTVPFAVIDTEGFDQPMTAYTMAIPAGWHGAAQMRWDNRNGQCSVDVASPNVRITSPDGSAQIEFLPGFMVSNSREPFLARGTQPGDYCVIAAADTGEKLVREIALPQLRPGWSLEALTAVAQPPSVRGLAESIAQADPTARVEGYALEALLRSADGRMAEKLAVSGVALTKPPLIAGVPPVILNQNLQTWSVRGPRADLDRLEATARAVLGSVRPDPTWQREVAAFRQRLIRASQPRPVVSPSSPANGGRSSDPGFDMDGWREAQRGSDRDQRRRIDGIREEEDCVDPETGRRYRVSIHVGCPQ